MAARRVRLTVDDVLQYYADSSDDAAADCEPDFDPDEPVMDGSDDEFSDLEGDEFDDDSDEDNPDTMHDTPAASSTATSSSSGDPDSTWSTTIKHLSIHPFTSPVGPTQDISSSPQEVFNLFFSPDLMERIVQESNAYAKRAMGDEKYDKWLKIPVEELKAFLGFSVLMDTNHLLSLNDYWSRDPRLRYAPVPDRIT